MQQLKWTIATFVESQKLKVEIKNPMLEGYVGYNTIYIHLSNVDQSCILFIDV